MTLTEAIIVRISHDLAGAIGAFANTVDLMKMDASFIGESIDLLDTSAHQLTARLAFFRALFGAESKSIDTSLIHNYLDTLAISVNFQGELQTRLQLALVAVGLELLGTGGSLQLSDKTLLITCPDLNPNPLLVQALMDTKVPCDPKLVTTLWLVHLAQEAHLSIHLDTNENKITLSLT